MSLNTKTQSSSILLELDKQGMLFPSYTFLIENGNTVMLGETEKTLIYEMQHRGDSRKRYALKVLGLKIAVGESNNFLEAVKAQKLIGSVDDCVIKVIDYKELWLVQDKQNRFTAYDVNATKGIPKDAYKLQLVLMEKAEAVSSKNVRGKEVLNVKALADGKESEIIRFALDIGHALQKAHHLKVLHRDIKLQNVFYSAQDGKYKLGDFGSATETEDGFAEKNHGTPGYTAPEVREEVARYDKTADIYSFGIMLYRLANKMNYPAGNSTAEIIKNQYATGYVVPKPSGHISNALFEIIKKACMYDPDDRYQSMDELVDDLEQLLFDNVVVYRIKHRVMMGKLGLLSIIFGITMGIAAFAPNLPVVVPYIHEMSWITITATVTGITLLYQYLILSNPERMMVEEYYQPGKLLYGSLYFYGFVLVSYLNIYILTPMAEQRGVDYVIHFDLPPVIHDVNWLLVGVSGLLLSGVWIIREKWFSRHR